MTVLVGLLGGKGSGKDTAARYLCEKLGGKQYAIADELKHLVKRIYDFTDMQMWGTQAQKEAGDPSPRKGMEDTGSALRVVYGEDFQVGRLLEKVAHEAYGGLPVAIISDVRYASEARYIREANTRFCDGPVFSDVFLVRLQYAPGLRRWPSTHQSEKEYQGVPVDLEITPGAGGVSELYAALDGACEMLGLTKNNASLIDGAISVFRELELKPPLPLSELIADGIRPLTSHVNYNGIAKFLGSTPTAVKNLPLTPLVKCPTCYDDPRGELIDCDGSAGYMACEACGQESDHKFSVRSVQTKRSVA